MTPCTGAYRALAFAASMMWVVAHAPLAAQVGGMPAPRETSRAVREFVRLTDTFEWIRRLEFGQQLVRERPDDPVAHALNAIAKDEYSKASTEVMVERWPENAWVHLARSEALQYTTTGESQKSLARARQLAPDDPNIAYFAARIWGADANDVIALVDTFLAQGRATPELRALRARAMARRALDPDPPDSLLLADALDEFAAVRSTSPTTVQNLADEAWVLRELGRHAETLPLLARAAELSSSDRHALAYWKALRAQPGRPLEDRLVEVFAAVDLWLTRQEPSPSALYVAAGFFLKAPKSTPITPSETAFLVGLYDRLMTEHPETREAATAALDRATLLRDSLPRLHGADSIAAVQRYRAALLAITRMPGATVPHSPVIPWPALEIATEARIALFRDLRGDPLTTGEALWSLYEQMQFEPTEEEHLRFSHLEAPVALAERGVRLAEAESLVRSALDALEDRLEEARRDGMTVEQYAERLSAIQADVHKELGWVLFHAGKLAEARRVLEKVHELTPRDADVTLRLGRVAEADDDVETAEGWYVLGRGSEPPDGANSKALERLHATYRATEQSLDAYIAAISAREQARRHEEIAAGRIVGGQPLVAFELEWMDGGRFDSGVLEGKIVILNFWGAWCEPCRQEAPDIQKFADELRDDPDVVFLTIANDRYPETTRGWMRQQGYTFPVLLEADSRLGERMGRHGFPTTIFVGRDGRVAFTTNSSPRLVEEFGWRVEMLREGTSR